MWAGNAWNKKAFLIIILKELLKYLSISTIYSTAIAAGKRAGKR